MLERLIAFKELIAVVASLIAVVAGVVGVLTFFATKGELNKLACEASTGLQLQDANTRRLEAEQAIFNAKVTRNHLKEKRGSDIEIIKIDQIIEIKGKELTISIGKQSELSDFLKNRKCEIENRR